MKINGAFCHIACDLRRFSIECRETKTKVTQKANQKKGENLYSQWEHKVIAIKRPGKARTTISCLILVLHLIGWKNGASFQDQSQSDVSYFRHSTLKVNCFHTPSKYKHDTSAFQLVLKTNYALEVDIGLMTDENILSNPKVTLCAHVLSYQRDIAETGWLLLG